jgi:hypothetical protein
LCQYDGGKGFSSLGVVMDNSEKKLIYKIKEVNKETHESVGIVIPKKVHSIYLRIIANFNGACNFEYSFDNKKYTVFGGASKLSWAFYRGTRLGIYNYNNKQEIGFIDVDWFKYEINNK